MIRAAAFVLLAAAALHAQSLEGFEVFDRPGDAGGTVIAAWKGVPGGDQGVEYVVSVAPAAGGEWAEVERFSATLHRKVEAPAVFGYAESNERENYCAVDGLLPAKGAAELAKGHSLETRVRVEAFRGGVRVALSEGSASARPNWWAPQKTNVLVFALLFGAGTFWLIARARRNPDVFVRRIPGLDAMEEAIGRATEMGRPIVYLNGLNGMDSISTIASVSILGQVSRRVASYDSQVLVPCYDPVVLSVSQEVLREGYTAAGRPDKFREHDAWFITQEQFSYVAAVDGLMLRERPAACFYMGYYYAESLLLAETGGSTGAIQIAGTDSVTQLPFFIATCDYTLIGEELYAASAYLSREPLQLGSLRSQDFGKIVIVAVLVLGGLVALTGALWFKHLFTVAS